MGTYPPAQIEAVPPTERPSTGKRQRRSVELKRRIVEETLVVGASVARVARAHGINANQVFAWRRLYEQGRLGNQVANSARLLPVSVSDTALTEVSGAVLAESPAQSDGRNTATTGSIHLELPKARVRIEGNIDPAVLCLVLQSVLG